MEDTMSVYSGKLKECQDILAAIPTSAIKSKAGSVQHLLTCNNNIIEEIKSIQASTDKEKHRSLPELANQLEQNLQEVIRVYKDL
mmetsp:Transcript_58839/g.115713  ORF Transcript_58839/g.115713 Transcript_58839/m.115713 type:complete len:85 (+) Transcript_58839:94-348(+)